MLVESKTILFEDKLLLPALQPPIVPADALIIPLRLALLAVKSPKLFTENVPSPILIEPPWYELPVILPLAADKSPEKVASPSELSVIPFATLPIWIPASDSCILGVEPSNNSKPEDDIAKCSVDVGPIVVLVP